MDGIQTLDSKAHLPPKPSSKFNWVIWAYLPHIHSNQNLDTCLPWKHMVFGQNLNPKHRNIGQIKTQSTPRSRNTRCLSLTFEVDCPGCCQWLLVAGALALWALPLLDIRPTQTRQSSKTGFQRRCTQIQHDSFGQNRRQTDWKLRNQVWVFPWICFCVANYTWRGWWRVFILLYGCYRYLGWGGARQTSGFTKISGIIAFSKNDKSSAKRNVPFQSLIVSHEMKHV